MEPKRRPYDHRGDHGWWFKLNEEGYPTVSGYRRDDSWSPVEGDPVLLDAIYDIGHEEGESNAYHDLATN